MIIIMSILAAVLSALCISTLNVLFKVAEIERIALFTKSSTHISFIILSLIIVAICAFMTCMYTLSVVVSC